MDTTVNVQLPGALVQQATAIFNDYGLDWSSALCLILTQVVSDHALSGNIWDNDEVSPELAQSILITGVCGWKLPKSGYRGSTI
ncbi:MAG: hypothetical protein Q4A55_04080 [Aerococcus sp.]|nr:hypothetical protein [Aerococcus sp.]